MSVSHIVCLHLFDILGIRHREKHIFSCNAKGLTEDVFNVRNVLQNLKHHYGIKRSVAKRKKRIGINDRNPRLCCPPEIVQVDITAKALDSLSR